MPKTITIVTANYFPEETAIGFYTTQFSKYLVDKDYNVNIITGFPYYPQWKIYKEYRDKESFINEKYGKINIYRHKQFVPEKPSFFSRIKMMITFLRGSLKNIKQIKQTDLVIVIVPFTLSVIPAFILSRRTNAKLWIHIQDFEFDLAFETGILARKNLITNLFKTSVLRFERYLLNKAFIISSISQNMMHQAQLRTKNKFIYFFPNWISKKQIESTSNSIHSYFDSDKFSILYSGNIGDKQNWTLLEDLCRIIPSNTNIEIVIVGNGGYANTLKDKLKQYAFVKFYPVVPLEELGLLLSSPHLHFLFQKTDVIDSVMPSKILGMMASGKTSLITGHKESEVARIFNTNEVGIFESEDNAELIYNKILELMESPDLSLKFGENAKKYIWENFSEEKILHNFEEKINSILNE